MSKITETRRRSSADSRERLLDAAGELFAERGYDNTTVREVGQRAEVDPALIARYFGSKSALYLASLHRDGKAANPALLDLGDPKSIEAFLDRIGPSAPTPSLHAAIQPHDDPQLQAAAMDVLGRRIGAVAAASARAAGLDLAALRAEIATAALAGIVLSRKSGAFEGLSGASSEDVGRLVAELLNGLLTP